MLSICAFMLFMVWIISGIIAVSWGMSVSRRCMSGSRLLMSSVMTSIPSRVSNTDRSDQQTGMS
ncbi:Uncharacterised protein [Mycobacterium tuberculosis]|uniref:Transmembrane protein n=1 Tax=Mycobacterium tuberculosis TaxID=1773 RepID=A0A655ETI3_MYCTX|nr:Uncharacterised protein [Mycobacterium tuberculosis]CFS37292.1 Uncharacterised protein [Mycobacterium tuberculosis]CKO18313.1 Uncharacterised protein [Mycobacterium tuberculosis]CKT28999.1 Uncharacterised protein [Mycobacterium tuberculosis]CNV34428.1 Uncharacterised protein [Mycobacterium tuberculosis]